MAGGRGGGDRGGAGDGLTTGAREAARLVAVVTIEAAGQRLAFAGWQVAALAERILADLDRTHRAESDNPGLLTEEIAASVPAPDRPAFPAALARLVRDGAKDDAAL
ncbi:hypothetical protein ACRAWG_21070 [Methylobacterium sp. P31]